jgi:molybdopterin/thiamine biosynthesis adenylyltransferase
MSELLDSTLRRYVRQTIFAPIGAAGQAKLAAAAVAVVGCGALGSAAADLLARAGVGRLKLIDRDFVEIHNLQRQSLYDEADVLAHTPKALAAAARLGAVNSAITIEPVVTDLNSANVGALLGDVDLFVDGSDNFETRYLLNDYAIARGIPWVYGGVIAAYGMTMTIRPGSTPCLRCLFPEQPEPGSAPTCDTAGVIGPAVHVVASLQATEALKLLVGATDATNDGLLAIDLWALTFDRVRTGGPRAGCPACQLGQLEHLARPVTAKQTVLCGQDSVQVLPGAQVRVDLETLAARLRSAGEVQVSRFLLRFTDAGTGRQITVFPDGRAIVAGTTDGDEARRLYATFVGA